MELRVYKQKRKDGKPRVSLCSGCGAKESIVFWKEWDNDDGWGAIYCHSCKLAILINK